MNTLDQSPAATHLTDAPQKRAYETPRIVDLGDVRELTRGGGGTKFDGRGKPAKH